MNTETDFYSVLGILPDAEGVVVVAAYRALASLYHPDRWKGNVADATARMAEINVAYNVLGNSEKRTEYDGSRKSKHGTYKEEDAAQNDAFDAALNQLEDRWKIAVNVYPDLANIRKALAKTAHRLAFAFVTVMLETKQFQNRRTVAQAMEKAFLERYFGTNERILSYAKELVQCGLKDAVVALNRYVDILGPETDPILVISKIENDYKVREIRKAIVSAQELASFDAKTLAKIEEMKATVRHYRIEKDARKLASLLGYEVATRNAGLFKPETYEVRESVSQERIATLRSPQEFTEWVLRSFC